MIINEIMNRTVQMISPDATIVEAAWKMKIFDVVALPVEKKGEILGMITDRDIVISAVADRLNPQTTPVSTVMTANVICCPENMSIEDAAGLMQQRNTLMLLVLDNNDQIAGILSVDDIARKAQDKHHLYHVVLDNVCEPANAYRRI
jgi:CBS domain-containing protein